MSSKKHAGAKFGLEPLETRALLTAMSFAAFADLNPAVVSDTIGTCDVTVNLQQYNGSQPVTVTVGTGGGTALPAGTETIRGGVAVGKVTRATGVGTAVPGVDYTPVQQTVTLTPTNPSITIPIPILPGPASLGTRILPVGISPGLGPNTEWKYIVITHGTDTTEPYVVSSEGLTVQGKVVAFAVQFNKPMALGPVSDPANFVVGAALPANYDDPGVQFAGIGTNGHAGLFSYANNVRIRLDIYDSATNTVYLIPVKPVTPTTDPTAVKGHEQFQVASVNEWPDSYNVISSLSDDSGNPISNEPTGNPNAIAGGFVQNTSITKASPSILAYLFGTATKTHASKPSRKPSFKTK